MLWMSSTTAQPSNGLSPTDFGWISQDGLLQPVWYKGPALPENLFKNSDDSTSQAEVSIEELSESDSEAWSEESDGSHTCSDDE